MSCIRGLVLPVCCLKISDDDFTHLHHGLHYTVGFGGIGVVHEFGESGGDDLPGEAIFVFEPTTHAFLAAVGGEFVPVVVDFFLGVDADKEGD